MIDIVLDPVQKPELWRGAVTWRTEGEWRQPWRLLPDSPGLGFTPVLAGRAKAPAGVRAEVITDAAEVTVEVEASGDGVMPVDVVIDGVLAERLPLRAGSAEVITARLPGRRSRVEVWLPQFGEVRIAAPTLRAGTVAEPVPSGHRLRWLCYGSSITQCRSAPGPTETWPALVARPRDWDLTCLGFGGQCHLDPMVIEVIGQQRVDLISLCLGINVYGSASYGARTWRGAVLDFLSRVRRVQPATPIMIMSPIASPPRDATPNAVGMTLDDYRAGVHEVVETLIELGDEALSQVDGRTIFGAADAAMLPDGLHPDADGYRLMATRIGPILEDRVAAGPSGGTSGSRRTVR